VPGIMFRRAGSAVCRLRRLTSSLPALHLLAR